MFGDAEVAVQGRVAYVIYRIVHRDSGKSYVGLTSKGLKACWNQHVRRAARGEDHPLARAIRKYGPESFERVVLEEVIGIEAANQAEQRWTTFFGSTVQDHGYNLTPGGGAVCMDEAARRKLSERATAREAAMTREAKTRKSVEGVGRTSRGIEKRHRKETGRKEEGCASTFATRSQEEKDPSTLRASSPNFRTVERDRPSAGSEKNS